METNSGKNQEQGRIYLRRHTSWPEDVEWILDRACLPDKLRGAGQILIKPNLVEDKPPPVTTPVELVATIVDYLQTQVPGRRILIGEGCGATRYDTWRPFEKLGYVALAREKGIELLDLNEAGLVHLSDAKCERWPEIYLPRVLFESFVLSVPVLKAHTLADVTLTMKNMMGVAPPAHYRQGGCWKKAAFHRRIHEAVFDLNRYRAPDFTVLDATVGMCRAHLWGPTCEPPPNKVAAAYDPVALDAYGASLLGREWREIGHIRMAHGELGTATPLEIISCQATP